MIRFGKLSISIKWKLLNDTLGKIIIDIVQSMNICEVFIFARRYGVGGTIIKWLTLN